MRVEQILKISPGIYLELLRKTMKILSKMIWDPKRDLNRVTPEYKRGDVSHYTATLSSICESNRSSIISFFLSHAVI
jgi:hypothetical protein